MAYSDPLDPTTPTGANSAGEGDDRIRELKRAIIERLETVFQDIDADPLKLILDAIDLATDISDGTIPGAKLVDGSVSLAKLSSLPGTPAGSIGTAQLADGSVTTPKIADLNVTTPKLADGAVTTIKIADDSVRRAKLYPGMRFDLCRFGLYILVLGAVIIPAGDVYRGFANLNTNDQVGGAVACIIQPAYDFSAASDAIHNTDFILSQCSVTLNGAQEILVYRLHNLLAAPVDLTGQIYYIWMIQRLDSAPPEV